MKHFHKLAVTCVVIRPTMNMLHFSMHVCFKHREISNITQHMNVDTPKVQL